MVGTSFAETTSSNGEFRFDQGVVRLGVGAAAGGVLLFGACAVGGGLQEGFLSILSLCGSLAFLGAAIHISRYSGRTLRITDDGILISDKRGSQICGIRWAELARVTERRRMAQLALWDTSGTRRVLVDQQYEKFALIRARVLQEYAKVFALKPLPIEFQHPNPMLLETLVFGAGGVCCLFVTWITFSQGQLGLSVCFLFFAAASCMSVLNLHPRIAGPSGLFGDELVLRGLFKTEKLHRSDISSVELQDMANQYGQPFSFIVLNTRTQQLKITAKFGSIPELYLTLRAWLQH